MTASSTRRTSGFKTQLVTLMFIRTVEPLSICQLFAYVNPMCEYLLPGTDKADIGKYSGAIESAFAIGSFLAAYQWGRLSDRIGRRPALLMGMLGIAVSALAFGLSKNFYLSLTARFLGVPGFQAGNTSCITFLPCSSNFMIGGALCGNASVVRATLGEITPPEAEHWVYPYVLAPGSTLRFLLADISSLVSTRSFGILPSSSVPSLERLLQTLHDSTPDRRLPISRSFAIIRSCRLVLSSQRWHSLPPRRLGSS